MSVAPALLLALLAALLAPAAPATSVARTTAPAPHDNSWSQSLVEVQPDGFRAFLRVQALSVVELPGVDTNDDLWLDQAELDARRELVLATLERDWAWRAAATHDAPPLKLELLSMELVEHGRSALDLERFVECEWRWRGPPPPVLRLDMQLFARTSPQHIDTCRVVWPDGSVADARTWSGKPQHLFERPAGVDTAGVETAPADPERAAFLDDLRLGVEHMLTGWDHLAFLLGLLAACAGWRALLALVTAFTLAHSATLALAAYGLVRLPSGPVELGIAASIAYVGALALFARRPRTLWIEAAVFGLVHGLGFASLIARQLQASGSPLQLLVAFNLGLELGQLAVVGALVLLLAVLRQRGEPVETPSGTRRWLLPFALRKLAALLALAAGLWWTVERGASLYAG